VAEKAKFRVTHRSKFGELCRAFNAHIDLLVVVVSHHQGGWLFDGQGAGEREGGRCAGSNRRKSAARAGAKASLVAVLANRTD